MVRDAGGPVERRSLGQCGPAGSSAAEEWPGDEDAGTYTLCSELLLLLRRKAANQA